MRIGELAKTAGASARSIRYYERCGLLAAERAANGYREFGPGSVVRVRQIKRLLADGFGLADVRALLGCLEGTEGGLRPCDAALTRYAKTLRALDRRIASLEAVRERASAGLAALRRRTGGGRG